jgi:hypothetical protein
MDRLELVVIAVTVVAGCAACSDDTSGQIDAATDADVDAIDAAAGPCGVDYQMTGEYVDWDSAAGSFDGVESAVWTVINDTARTATTAPNGRIIICLARTSTVTLSVVQTVAAPNGPYVEARFVADPAVLSPAGGIFSSRGLKTALADSRYTTIAGAAISASAGHVLVVKRGTPTALTLGASPSFVSDGAEDTSWISGNTGAFTLFPNVPLGAGTATLGGTFTGPTTIPLEAGLLTIVPIS